MSGRPRLAQVGIRTLNQHQREQVARFGGEVIPAPVFGGLRSHSRWALYLSIDLDGLINFAPGVSHHEPGGLTVELLTCWTESTRGWSELTSWSTTPIKTL